MKSTTKKTLIIAGSVFLGLIVLGSLGTEKAKKDLNKKTAIDMCVSETPIEPTEYNNYKGAHAANKEQCECALKAHTERTGKTYDELFMMTMSDMRHAVRNEVIGCSIVIK